MNFADYISQCQKIIETKRPPQKNGSVSQALINATNTPYDLPPLHPDPNKKPIGVLLVHGLLDCPFTLRDIGNGLQKENIHCRSILLPGHGTQPLDLNQVSHQDWLKTVAFGVESFQDCDKVFIIGYSTGAALALHHALTHHKIAGLILISPAIKIRFPVQITLAWSRFMQWMFKDEPWVFHHAETDYAKYLSFTIHPVQEVNALANEVKELNAKTPIETPILMIASQDDETISCKAALEFFASLSSQHNQCILYTRDQSKPSDTRITIRSSVFPDLRINHFAHVSLTFAPDNYHYGQKGDYPHASHPEKTAFIFGGYNYLIAKCFDKLNALKLVKYRRSELTYNPDFAYMFARILKFIQTSSSS